MIPDSKIDPRFKDWGVAVLIPTYNNDSTLKEVVSGVLQYTNQIIVLNDGSTDQTKTILEEFEDKILVHSFNENQGKGAALMKGFDLALEKNYQFLITIDSDGQHYPDDLPQFLDQLDQTPNSLIVGARNMDQNSVPGGSSFGNKFSNFWYKLETGIDLPDTQSGYRLYPIQLLKDISFFTGKYEFEIEILVRAAWRDVNVTYCPIKVYYPPQDERISHFRPYKDFARISVLNTFLVIITFLYIKPRNLIRAIQKKKLKDHVKDFIEKYLLHESESNFVKALSISLGIFVALSPFWGFHLIITLFLAHIFKLNKVISGVASNISIPPLIPFIIFASYKLGSWVSPSSIDLKFDSSINVELIHENFMQYVVGSFMLGLIVSSILGLITYGTLSIFYKKGNIRTSQ